MNLKDIIEKQNTGVTKKLFETKTKAMNKENKLINLLRLFLDGWVLSKRQIRNKVNLVNEGDAVKQLRDKGYRIKMLKVENQNTGTKFGVYFIPDRVKDIDLVLKSYNN